jgi:hypothetical protein
MQHFEDPAEFARKIQGQYLSSAHYYEQDGSIDASTVSADPKDRPRPLWTTTKWHHLRGTPAADPVLATAVDTAGVGVPFAATLSRLGIAWELNLEALTRFWGPNFTGIATSLSSPATALGIRADPRQFTKALDTILGPRGELADTHNPSVEPGRSRPVHRLELLANFLKGAWCPLSLGDPEKTKHSPLMADLKQDIIPATYHKGREQRLFDILEAFSIHPGYIASMNPCEEVPLPSIVELVVDMACHVLGMNVRTIYDMPKAPDPAILRLFEILAVSETFADLTVNTDFHILCQRSWQLSNLSPNTWTEITERAWETSRRFRAVRALQDFPDNEFQDPEPFL